jgi:hypothetical protein
MAAAASVSNLLLGVEKEMPEGFGFLLLLLLLC